MISHRPMSDAMRVLFVTNGLRRGGSEKLLVEMINRLDRHKIEATIVSLAPAMPLKDEIYPNKADLLVFARKWRYDLTIALKLRRLLSEKHFQVIVPFAMFDYFFTRLATLGQKQYPKTYIYIHSTVPPNFKWFIQDWLYTRFLRHADEFISVCDAQADYWAKRYGIAPEKFSTIYGSVDVKHFDPDSCATLPRDIRKEYQIPANAFVILLTAALKEYKRQEDALRALALLSRQTDLPVHLLLVGGGTSERISALETLAETLGVRAHVSFCGEQRDVRPFLCAANLFTLTSSSVETFSIAALEAMSMGLPCVLTRIGGAAEMIRSGENGFLVEPENPQSIADGWLKVLQNRHTWTRQQIRAHVVENFSLSSMVSRMEQRLCAS